MVSAEDFDQWRDNPVTRWVMQAHANAAAILQDEWIAASWGDGVADSALLADLRTRADAYLALRDTPYEMWCQFNNDGDAK